MAITLSFLAFPPRLHRGGNFYFILFFHFWIFNPDIGFWPFWRRRRQIPARRTGIWPLLDQFPLRLRRGRHFYFIFILPPFNFLILFLFFILVSKWSFWSRHGQNRPFLAPKGPFWFSFYLFWRLLGTFSTSRRFLFKFSPLLVFILFSSLYFPFLGGGGGEEKRISLWEKNLFRYLPLSCPRNPLLTPKRSKKSRDLNAAAVWGLEAMQRLARAFALQFLDHFNDPKNLAGRAARLRVSLPVLIKSRATPLVRF